MIASPIRIASADPINQVPVYSKKPECTAEIINSLEKFVQALGSIPEAYVTLGSKYSDCDNYVLAKENYNKAIEVAKPNSEVQLIAQYKLIEIKFLSGEIDENELKILSQKVFPRLNPNGTTRSAFSVTNPCPDFCANVGLFGKRIFGSCIPRC
jgi:tetratricopeptide (TPR) repeat protein